MDHKINNPILKGFNPDPCIVKAEDTYYIAVSSFEWLPGVRVYESKNLVDWAHLTDILTTQVDLKGNPSNCSIWAPQLSYSDGQFHLVYTDVKSTQRPFKDAHNYLISSSSIHGPWSEPVYLNSSGFDPSLFHDEDGKKWLLNALWDYRMTTSNKSSGIVLQEYDPIEKRLVGSFKKIFDCTELKKTEAPHIYKKDGYYYLITAEGGTGIEHSVTVARSRSIEGPYEVDPEFPMMTSSGDPEWPMQCAGHGSLIKTDDDEWYMAHLMTRPLDGNHAILGRETSLQKVIWNDEGWLRLAHGGVLPALEVETPKGYTGRPTERASDFYDDFSAQSLNKEWNTLRISASEDWLTLKERPGYLRLYAGESVQSVFDQHLIAKRQEDFHFIAKTELSFEPMHYLQMAGLLLYLNTENYLYLCITHDEKQGKVLRSMKSVDGVFELSDQIVGLNTDENVILSVEADHGHAQFSYNKEDAEPTLFGDKQDITFLSGGFTGDFIALAVQDMNQFKGCHADFTYFDYKGLDQ